LPGFSLHRVTPGADVRRILMGEFIDKAKGAANEAIGKAKVAVGEQTNDAELVAKGGAQELKGKAQQVAGDVKGKLGNKF
jgi:uncharacterized protein YjbJ (UPF0337 family)